MRIKVLPALALTFLVHATSHAGVLYEWKPLDRGLPQDITLRLEFDDAVVRSGYFNFSFTWDQPENAYHNSGLTSLYYAFPGATPMVYSLDRVVPPSRWGYMSLGINFSNGELVGGSIYANDTQHDIALSGQGRIWTITGAHSDQYMVGAGCPMEDWNQCRGATGQFRQVPEPVSLALFGIGALGAVGALRRRKGVRDAA